MRLRVLTKAIFAFSLLVSGSVANADWILNRDNSFVPISPNEDGLDGLMARNLALITTAQGSLTGLRICPGVYLTSAHGVTDSFQRNGRRYFGSKDFVEMNITVHPFPYNPEAGYTVNRNDQVVTGWGRSEINIQYAFRDYAFLLVGDPTERPSDTIRPARVELNDIQLKVLGDDWQVSHFRAESFFERDENGFPDGDRGISLPRDPGRFGEVFRVAEECSAAPDRRGQGGVSSERMIVHNCPSEPGASGSPLMLSVADADYLLAINTDARVSFEPVTVESRANLSGATPANEFCSEYATLCGQRCEFVRD